MAITRPALPYTAAVQTLLIAGFCMLCICTGDSQPLGAASGRPVARQLKTQYYSGTKLLIVTAVSPDPCKISGGGYFNTLSLRNKQDYAELNDYEFYWFSEETDPRFYGPWNKMALLRELLRTYDSSQVEWFMWVDVDTLFTQVDRAIPFERYNDKDLVLWKVETKEHLDGSSLNSGVILIRNSAWSKQFVERVCYYGDGWGNFGESDRAKEVTNYLKDGNGTPFLYDQSGIAYVLRVHPEWGQKVFYEMKELPGYYGFHIHFRWDLPLDKMYDWPWPLITHYAGCQFCSYATSDGMNADHFGLCALHFLTVYGYARNTTIHHSKSAAMELQQPFDVVAALEKLAKGNVLIRDYMYDQEHSQVFQAAWSGYRPPGKVEEGNANEEQHVVSQKMKRVH